MYRPEDNGGDNRPYKRDYKVMAFAFALFVASVAMTIVSIWTDWRWFLTAIIVFLIGCFFTAVSSEMDKRYKAKNIRQ